MTATGTLVVYVLWLLLVFGLRSLIQTRRTGDAGWRSPGGRPGSLQRWSRTIVGFGAVAAALAAPAAALGHGRRLRIVAEPANGRVHVSGWPAAGRGVRHLPGHRVPPPRRGHHGARHPPRYADPTHDPRMRISGPS